MWVHISEHYRMYSQVVSILVQIYSVDHFEHTWVMYLTYYPTQEACLELRPGIFDP